MNERRLAFATGFAALCLLAMLGAPGRAGAQPFNAWATFSTGGGHIAVPASPALNPTGAFTFEAWVLETSANPTGEDCRSIAGKGYLSAWWVGICRVSGTRVVRAYLKGGGSAKNGGIVPLNQWTHIAVTFDGVTQRHYINGELAFSTALAGPLTTGAAELRIGSDFNWDHPPAGSIDEVRLWNVARTIDEIREDLNEPISVPRAGLVAVWALDGNANDVIGPYDGAVVGSVLAGSFPAVLDCGASTVSALCLNTRFRITSQWRTNPTPGTPVDGDGHVVVAGAESGIFWFFSSSNWEIMVKALNGCGLNNRYWIFSAATTNVFYRMTVLDVRAGRQKIYFNYPGPPAPALTDVNAFATCP